MNFSVLVLVSIVAMATFTSVDSWRRRRFRIRIRGRRIFRIICRPLCSTVCRTYCHGCAPVCGYGCKKICKGKRETTEVSDKGVYVKPMPCDFKQYDVNADGVIDATELGRQNDEPADAEDVKQLFRLMDIDGDGGVSPGEFEVAPLDKDCGKGGYTNKDETRGLDSDLEDTGENE